MTTFRPLPLLGNPHVQTVLGALLRGKICPAPQRRHVVALPDGDALLLHENRPDGWQPGMPVAMLVHGLTGSHLSSHISRMAGVMLGRGVRVFRADLRGAGEALPLGRGSYHAGRSEDLREALAFLHALAPKSPLLLVGVSLGGNMALKLGGEMGEHPVPGLARIATIAPPLDLEACSRLILQPRNRIYERRFYRDLRRDAEVRQRRFPDLPPLDLPRRLNLVQFDDLYTGPRNGFAGAIDYYRHSSAFRFVPRIPVPTLLIAARDDPFVAVAPFDLLRVPDHVRVVIADRGGHVGFLGADGAGGVRWAERYVVEWLLG